MKKSAYQMKNSMLKMAAKGAPMQKNYGPMLMKSPMRDDVYGAKTKFAKEEAERKSKLPLVENIAGGRKSYDKINTAANTEYLEKGNKALAEITKKTNKKLKEAESYNKGRQNYLNKVSSVLPTAAQAAKSKGTLRATPSLTTRLKNKVKNLFN